ncbi:riboflavin synthase [Nanchangia anserum]|uniref:Riboflavin synthase n=1 Tax=Nanchangia anserum TaxID=2692125 RepID=A0A8I0GDY3_9ACTO|nr:riboflavin synthase [Nanchangia anserum]MBD3689097.1 riboflavin synthase [Nanchangia anserum]QOX81334.1 riboflavin synthase [Nanchangia anserum]
MFTGLVEATGRLCRRVSVEGAAVVTIEAPFAADLAEGDSVSTAGVCLSVTSHTAQTFTADVMPETLAVTTLASLPEGTRVNLERALAANGRLGGHLVQGHVDGIGVVTACRPGPRWDEVDITCDVDVARYIAYKGSIAIDGVSLTVSAVTDNGFTVSLIPTTLEATTLGEIGVGTRVNLETDVMARYAERLTRAPKETEQ